MYKYRGNPRFIARHHLRGKNSPMYRKHHTKAMKTSLSKARLGKSWDELYGVKKANIMRHKLSLVTSGKNNPIWGRRGKSAPFFNKRHTKSSIKKMKLARLNTVIPFRDTSIEVKLQQGLIDRNILFKKHVPILGQPDIFISPGICIFADGDYWHGPEFPDQQKRDKYVNHELNRQGYTVLRFWEHDINNNLKKCFNKIQKVYVGGE